MSNENRTPKEFVLDAVDIIEAVPITNNRNPIDAFIQEQIRLWGFESVQSMFDNGFEPIMVANGKVLWAK